MFRCLPTGAAKSLAGAFPLFVFVGLEKCVQRFSEMTIDNIYIYDVYTLYIYRERERLQASLYVCMVSG